MPPTHHARSQSDDAVLTDVRAMLRAAERDPLVSKRLGTKYLQSVASTVAACERLVADGDQAAAAQVAAGVHKAEISSQLLTVMQEIRDAIELADEPLDVQRDFA